MRSKINNLAPITTPVAPPRPTPIEPVRRETPSSPPTEPPPVREPVPQGRPMREVPPGACPPIPS